jgi:cytochrome c-type biogenesis protein CcmF
MIFNVGYLILVVAMVLAVFGIAVGLWGGFKRKANFAAASFHAVYAVTALVTLAAVILWYGLLADRFELAYVWNHSERALPIFYKIAALWSGQSGSLLFWVMVLGIFSSVAAATYRHKMAVLMPYVNAVLLTTSLFFLVLLIFAANPFEQYGFSPPDGHGLGTTFEAVHIDTV